MKVSVFDFTLTSKTAQRLTCLSDADSRGTLLAGVGIYYIGRRAVKTQLPLYQQGCEGYLVSYELQAITQYSEQLSHAISTR
ncbi:stannin isoform X3 [Rhinatrema bivittatum]|uniref:stannin isoform X3 n=1 Tax=Rhinatrema bivittatum TaxID=194408 RepID=UPI00112B6B24|nr:stannin isoform X3 [Rhinatrema bivittatum]